MGRKPTGRPTGRPPKEYDQKLFEELCHIWCTREEIFKFIDFPIVFCPLLGGSYKLETMFELLRSNFNDKPEGNF